MSGAKPCPVASCCAPLRHGKLMCLYHWRVTPRAMQMVVNRTWRAYQAAKDAKTSLLRLREYRAARDTAVAHHNGKASASKVCQA